MLKRILTSALVALALSAALASCGGSGLTDDEIRETFRTLTEASEELNDIYYGDGLPYEENEAVMKYLLGVAEGTEGFKVNYMPVAETAAYKTEAEIRTATDAVFSDEMCTLLYQLGFEGMAMDAGETRVSFARYIEKEGTLTVRIDLASDAIPLGREYDFDAMTVIADESGRVKAKFPTTVDGKPSVDVSLTIIREPEGWRLDSPTY